MPKPSLYMRRLAAVWLCVLASATATAAEPQSFTVTVRGDAFQPAQLSVPAGRKIKLEIHNAGTIPAEFESYDLNREKVIGGHGTVTVYIGPLAAGSYKFFNDFNRKASGAIRAQ